MILIELKFFHYKGLWNVDDSVEAFVRRWKVPWICENLINLILIITIIPWIVLCNPYFGHNSRNVDDFYLYFVYNYADIDILKFCFCFVFEIEIVLVQEMCKNVMIIRRYNIKGSGNLVIHYSAIIMYIYDFKPLFYIVFRVF